MSPLRLRIAATIALVVLVSVVALGLTVHVLLVDDHVDGVRATADERVRAAAVVYRRTGLVSFDARVDDPRVPAALAGAVSRDGARATYLTGSGTRTVWAAARVGDHLLVTRTSFASVDDRVRRVDQLLVAAGAVVVVLASVAGAVLSGRLVRRLRLAARTARSVATGGDPRSLRSVVGDRRDEVGDLADAVDLMADRLQQRLSSEQRFTADVAHDLRTPVTGLVTAAGLLEPSRAGDLVRDRAAALARLVEDLLEVARLDHGGETPVLEEVDLAALVRRTVQRGAATGEHADDAVTVTTTPGALVVTDPRRVERVLSNLVRNGLRHGGGHVEVRQRGGVVTVRDDGPGFPASLLTGAGTPTGHRRSEGGSGLGLLIARGQAEVLGARLHLENAPDGGAVATLELPGAEVTEP